MTRPDNTAAWRLYLAKPTSAIAATYLKSLSQQELQELITAASSPDKDKPCLLSSIYLAFTSNNGLQDEFRLSNLEFFHKQHQVDLFQQLDPKSSDDTSPAALSMHFPPWLQRLIDNRELRVQARLIPSGGVFRKLKTTTALHLGCALLAKERRPEQATAIAHSCIKLLDSGSDANALDSCGLTPLEWALMEEPEDSSCSKPSNHNFIANNPLLPKLWQATSSLHYCKPLTVEVVVELMRMPSSQIAQHLQEYPKVLRDGDNMLRPAQLMCVLALRSSTWDHLLQVLELAPSWTMAGPLKLFTEKLVVRRRIAAGAPSPFKSIKPFSADPAAMTSQQRARLMHFWKRNMCMPPLQFVVHHATGIPDELYTDDELAQKLPQALIAALLWVDAGILPAASPQAAAMLDAACRWLNPASLTNCFVAAPEEERERADRRSKRVVDGWLEMGLVKDLEAAAKHGSYWAVKALVSFAHNSNLGRNQQLAEVFVRCLLDHGHAGRLAGSVGQLADELAKGRPLALGSQGCVEAIDLLIDLKKLRCELPRRSELCEGQLGQQLRKVAGFVGDTRLADFSALDGVMTAIYSSAVEMAARITGSASAEVLQAMVGSREAAYDESCASKGVNALMADALERVVSAGLKAVTREVRRYGKACDECGQLAAQVEGDGGKLRQCGGCGQVWYCSRACQKRAWQGHKRECLASRAAAAAGAGGGAAAAGGVGGSGADAGSAGSSAGSSDAGMAARAQA